MKDEALKLALEALEKISRTHYHIETPPIESLEEKMRRIADKAITAIKQARSAPVQEPVAIPEGFSLVAVKGFDELMYWLDRCERKGHLENCPDLIEPYEAFDYRTSDTTSPAAQRQWVGLTDEQIDQGLCRTPYAMKTAEAWREGVRWAYHQLKEKNT